MNDPYIAILHGNDEEPHDPIVTTIVGGSHVERYLPPKHEPRCASCGAGRQVVSRIGRYEVTETHAAPEPFKLILVARLTTITELRPQ